MAVKGQDEKILITKKILEMFPGAFEYDKCIRIPVADVQIKVTLTCAKDNVNPGQDVAVPGEQIAEEPVKELVPPSEEELNAVSALMAQLGL